MIRRAAKSAGIILSIIGALIGIAGSRLILIGER